MRLVVYVESGVDVESIVRDDSRESSVDVFIICRLLTLVISTQITGRPLVRPKILVISDNKDFARALIILKRSALFQTIVLVHTNKANDGSVSPHSPRFIIRCLPI